MENLGKDAVHLLTDLQNVVNTIDPQLYTQTVAEMSNATIGQHTRHIVEFFQCLSEQSESGIINYCLRKRDKQIETDPQKAVGAIDRLMLDLTTLDFNKPLVLQTDETGKIVVKTNVAREIFYSTEHAIHHMAIIKVALKIIAPHTKLPKNFGVAPYRAYPKYALLRFFCTQEWKHLKKRCQPHQESIVHVYSKCHSL